MNPRPVKKPEDLSNRALRFTVTKAEKEEIERLARLHGYQKVSDYLRRTALGHQEVDRSKLEE